jgi:type IV pilus assembly protein PilM
MNPNQEKSYLAIELASSGIKMVKMKQKGSRFHLVEAKPKAQSLEQRRLSGDEQWQAALREMISNENPERQSALVTINSLHASFSQFILPRIPAKELAGTLKWKMKDQLSFPLEEATLDYRFSEAVKIDKEPLVSTLVSAVPRKVVGRETQILSAVGLGNCQPTQSIFSITSLSGTFPNASDTLVAVVDLGESITDIALYASGRLSFQRKIPFGGRHLTELMTQTLVNEQGAAVSLTWEEAEKVKRNEKLLYPQGDQLIEGKIAASKLHGLIRAELEKFIKEVKRSFDYYAHEHGDLVEQIYLTGGGSKLSGLVELFQENFDVPAKTVAFHNDFSVASHLQGQDLSPFYRLIGSILDHQAGHPTWLVRATDWGEKRARQLSPIQIGIACAAFLLLSCGFMEWRYQSMMTTTDDLKSRVENLRPGYEAAQEVRAIEQQIDQGDILRSLILQNEPYWIEVFEEFSSVIPQGAAFTSISYEGEGFLLEGVIDLQAGDTTVADILLALEGPIFPKVNLLNREKREQSIVFSIRTELQ